MKYDIRDLSLAPQGSMQIQWVKKHMPILRGIEAEFRKKQPFAGMRVAISIHFEAKTGYLAKVIQAGGAEVAITGSNPLSTRDEVAAALVEDGIHVFARRGATREKYLQNIDMVLDFGPHLVIDDGGDLIHRLHTTRRELLSGVLGGCEETTTGVLREKAMEREGILEFPVVAVNDAYCKYLFDNRYGTGQSVWDAINITTNLIVAGKKVVIVGYGWCGKGIAMRAKGLGALVTICEVDPIKSVEAVMDGFEVDTMSSASGYGDLFITASGCRSVIASDHYENMKDGAILCNAGHFNIEIDVASLEDLAEDQQEVREHITGYRMSDGRWLYLLAGAGLVNIAAGNGHPAEIMDMSFSLQALSAEYLLDHHTAIGKKVIKVPETIDQAVAALKLKAWGYEIDVLTPEQQEYLEGWK